MQLALNIARPLWRVVSDKAPFAARFADPHYSRQKPGSPQYLAPGQHLALWHETPTGCALWGVVLNFFQGELRWRNTIFRNEKSGTLSSVLVEHATATTYAEWRARFGGLPHVPFRTEIDVEATRARRSRRHAPGHCYLMAGWTHVRDIPPGHGRSAKVELEAPR
jgi:hypothetical protein